MTVYRKKASGGALLFKGSFKPRSDYASVEERVFLCPVCHEEIQQSAETCPHCRSQRLYGPTRLETALSIAVGVAAGLIYCFAILDSIKWGFPVIALGAAVGFYIAQIRFDGDRWRRPH